MGETIECTAIAATTVSNVGESIMKIRTRRKTATRMIGSGKRESRKKG